MADRLCPIVWRGSKTQMTDHAFRSWAYSVSICGMLKLSGWSRIASSGPKCLICEARIHGKKKRRLSRAAK